MMRVTIEGFGSMWSMRSRPDPREPGKEQIAFYNTTGVTLNGNIKHRSRIFGQLRLNAAGGFIAKGIERKLDRGFCCRGELGQSHAKLTCYYLAAKPEPPDFFLFAVQSNVTGVLQIESEHWKSIGVLLFSLSQAKESQEAILLMPTHSWFRKNLGTFIAEPDCDRPWRAALRLLG